MAILPVFLPVSRETANRDEFADDCLHRQTFLFSLCYFSILTKETPGLTPGAVFYPLDTHSRLLSVVHDPIDVAIRTGASWFRNATQQREVHMSACAH